MSYILRTVFFLLIALVVLVEDLHSQEVGKRPEGLDDDPKILSPLILHSPIYRCANTVVVEGYVPGARVQVFRRGDPNPIGDRVATLPENHSINISNPFLEGEEIFAVQIVDGIPSEPSNIVVTTNHEKDFPDGLPRPRLFGVPPLQCGRAIGIDDVPPGATATVFAENPIPGGGFEPPVVIGRAVDFPYTHVSPSFKLGAHVWAQSKLCMDESRPSLQEIVGMPPTELKAPLVDRVPEGSGLAIVRGQPGIGLENGATLEVFADSGGGGSLRRVGGQATAYDAQQVGIQPDADSNESHLATQALCEKSGLGKPTSVVPCAKLQPPVPRPIAPGDDRVEFITFHPGARIKIFADNTKIGDGSGVVVGLTRPISAGERIDILQEFPPACSANLVVTLIPECRDGGVPGVCSGDWPTFRQNPLRDGSQRTRSALSDPSRARTLQVVKSFRISEHPENEDAAPRGFVSSPIVYNGLVYIGSSGGRFYALDEDTLEPKWIFPKPNPDPTLNEPPLISDYTNWNDSSVGIASPATIVRIKNEQDAVIFGAPDKGRPENPRCPECGDLNGKLGAGLGSGRLFALDAQTGVLIWKSPEIAVLNGTTPGSLTERHEQIGYVSPLALGNTVYVGVGDHWDNPIQNGRIVAVNIDDGSIDSAFSFTSTNRRGGGVWSSLSGRQSGGIFVTTGNTNDGQSEPSRNNGLSLMRLNRSTGAIIWKMQPVPYAEDGDPDWASGVVLLDSGCGQIALSTMKDGFSYSLKETGPLAVQWQFPLAFQAFLNNPRFPDPDVLPHGDTRYHRAGAGWADTFITTAGGEQILDAIDQDDVIENYTAIHGLSVCGNDSSRVRWILTVPGTPASFGRTTTQLSPPSVAHGVIYVGTNGGHLVAFADPSIWPSQGARCSHTDFAVADCLSAGFQLVDQPTILFNRNLMEGSIKYEPVIANGAIFVATRGGAVLKLQPQGGL